MSQEYKYFHYLLQSRIPIVSIFIVFFYYTYVNAFSIYIHYSQIIQFFFQRSPMQLCSSYIKTFNCNATDSIGSSITQHVQEVLTCILFSNLLYEMGQDLMDIQYVYI